MTWLHRRRAGCTEEDRNVEVSAAAAVCMRDIRLGERLGRIKWAIKQCI